MFAHLVLVKVLLVTLLTGSEHEDFWVNPFGMHFNQICVSDLILVNKDGEVVWEISRSMRLHFNSFFTSCARRCKCCGSFPFYVW